MTIDRSLYSSLSSFAALAPLSRRRAVAAVAVGTSLPGLAQFRVEITGVGSGTAGSDVVIQVHLV